MTVHYEDEQVTVHHGDCRRVLADMPDGSVDAVVTDPPYGLEFMGKDWDAPWRSDRRQTFDGTMSDVPPNPYGRSKVRFGMGGSYGADGRAGSAFQVWCEEWATEALRVLRPGGHLLAFGGTRTFHRLAVAIEDAGFEIRDCLSWLYGSGFPKSMDVSKAIDKAAGAERVVVGREANWGAAKAADGKNAYGDYAGGWDITAPATPAAERWQGWGTALKPAWEPIIVARKPLASTVAANVLAHGTGALNIDGCRVGIPEGDRVVGGAMSANDRTPNAVNYAGGGYDGTTKENTTGRWPANVVLDEVAAELLDEQTGVSTSRIGKPRGSAEPGNGWGMTKTGAEYDDKGGASRFFYCAKADGTERHAGMPDGRNHHPTVKPLDLMRWLVRLVTPPGGVVLDPFAGSGTTGEACIIEGFRAVLIEREAEYLSLIVGRLGKPIQPTLGL